MNSVHFWTLNHNILKMVFPSLAMSGNTDDQ